MNELYLKYFENPQLHVESLIDFHLNNQSDLNKKGIDKTLTFWGKLFSSTYHASIFLEKLGERLLQDRSDKFSQIFQDISLYSNLKVDPLSLVNSRYNPIEFSVEQNSILWHSIPPTLKQNFFSTHFKEDNLDIITNYWQSVCERLNTDNRELIKEMHIELKEHRELRELKEVGSYLSTDAIFDKIVALRLQLNQEVEQLYFAPVIINFFHQIQTGTKEEAKNQKNKYLLKYCSIPALVQDRDFLIYHSAGFVYSPEDFQNVYLELRNSKYQRAKLYPVFSQVIEHIYKPESKLRISP